MSTSSDCCDPAGYVYFLCCLNNEHKLGKLSVIGQESDPDGPRQYFKHKMHRFTRY